MTIFRSIAVGKARNSAGEVTFYTRLGVSCFRQKPSRSGSYRATAAQLAQQKVFKFFKQNLDAFGVMSVVDTLFDTKAQSGKSQTTYNLFYKAFMPHIVAQKTAISAIEGDDLVDAEIFFGTADYTGDHLIEGSLGSVNAEISVTSEQTGTSASLAISDLALQALVDKANKNLSANDTLFTTANVMIGVVGAEPGDGANPKIVMPQVIAGTSEDGTTTYNILDMVGSWKDNTNMYFLIAVGYPTDDNVLDTTRKFYSADSITYTMPTAYDGPIMG